MPVDKKKYRPMASFRVYKKDMKSMPSPCDDCSIRVFWPYDVSFLWFLPCNSVAGTKISLKLSLL